MCSADRVMRSFVPNFGGCTRPRPVSARKENRWFAAWLNASSQRARWQDKTASGDRQEPVTGDRDLLARIAT
jgi:hypothetical protein